MHKHVELLIGRLATDPDLAARFAAEPEAVIAGLGLELTELEAAALRATDPEALRAFRAALDPRIKRASRATEMRSAPDTTTHEETSR
jgi:hypothetical protein